MMLANKHHQFINSFQLLLGSPFPRAYHKMFGLLKQMDVLSAHYHPWINTLYNNYHINTMFGQLALDLEANVINNFKIISELPPENDN
eukprot:UN05026